MKYNIYINKNYLNQFNFIKYNFWLFTLIIILKKKNKKKINRVKKKIYYNTYWLWIID